MIREEKFEGKNGKTIHIVYKNTPWRDHIDEFIRSDMDYMIVHIRSGLYSSIYSAKSGLDTAIKNSRIKSISTRIVNGNLCLIRNNNYA